MTLSNFVATHQRKNAFFFEFTAPKLGSFGKTTYLCGIKRNDMEEKRYPVIEEEENVGMCCEPSAAIDYNDADNFMLPVLGPSTVGEAIADIEESEKEFEAGKCLPWEDVMSEIKERYHLYAY